MDKIKVMVSSTVKDLYGERDAVKEAFKTFEFVELIGVDPVNIASLSSSSRVLTSNMAKECDLYILVLGKEFGLELQSGKSATEIEFDYAYRDDPTKILVFKKDYPISENINDKQQRFINRVCSYYNGYWRSTFSYTHELKELVLNSFVIWLKERASIGEKLDYLDHFIRLAKQIKPEPNATIYYKLEKDYVELEYNFFGTNNVIQFDRKEIYNDFWGCINILQEQFERWMQ